MKWREIFVMTVNDAERLCVQFRLIFPSYCAAAQRRARRGVSGVQSLSNNSARSQDYIGIILVLAFATYLIREVHGGIRQQAEALGVQEESLGEVELTDSMVRLSLTGSRGFAVCCLWLAAQEKQKKHEWNELEVLVKSLIKLQPHFVTPWLFQSWNLAYNVSVESDRVRDKYFYIAEGIKMIAKGCQINRFSPDMRYTVGFYTQHKIGLADEFHYLRCLYQMSVIDPKDRDPGKLLFTDEQNRLVVYKPEFEKFCKEHPMLVRRLHDTLGKPRLRTSSSSWLKTAKSHPSTMIRRDFENSDPKSPMKSPTIASHHSRPWPKVNASSGKLATSTTTRSPATGISTPCNSCRRPRFLRDGRSNLRSNQYRMPRFMTPLIFRQYPGSRRNLHGREPGKEGWSDRDGWKIHGRLVSGRQVLGRQRRNCRGRSRLALRSWGTLPDVEDARRTDRPLCTARTPQVARRTSGEIPCRHGDWSIRSSGADPGK